MFPPNAGRSGRADFCGFTPSVVLWSPICKSVQSAVRPAFAALAIRGARSLPGGCCAVNDDLRLVFMDQVIYYFGVAVGLVVLQQRMLEQDKPCLRRNE